MGKKREEWTCIAEREFDGDIVITDPCYVKDRSVRTIDFDWSSHEKWMAEHGLYNDTYYGDWGCTVYKAGGQVGLWYPSSESIGEFCADAGLVCVLDMRDARSMSPDIDDWIEGHKWCATVINGFRGKVRLMTKTRRRWFKGGDGKRVNYNEVDLRVRGDGTKDGEPFSFESKQTAG